MKLWKDIAFTSALTLAAFCAAAPGEAHEFKIGKIEIVHPWARQSPAVADAMAGFLTIRNGGEADRLVSATAEITPKVALHEMKMEGEVMKMVELKDGIAIPAGGTVMLKPKSLHVMFEELKTKPREGDEFKGTLTFEKAGTVEIEFMVHGPNAGMD